jgi:CheY-like chemotaxis protein
MMTLLLVVEDDAIIRMRLKILLEMEGYRVREASNGRDALEFLRQSRDFPCLVVLDLMMPVMDGIEFRRTQLQDPDPAHVPVVIVTGKNDLKEVDDLQPLHIVRKPFQADVLLELIETHCPRR